MKKLTLLSIVIFALSLSKIGYAQKNSEEKPATLVIVSPVIEREFSDTVEALATTRSNENVVITADRSEKVASIHFKDGQFVKKGELLITLDKGQEEAQLRSSEALTEEKLNAYNRAKSLKGSSALPISILQGRFAELKQSQAATQAIKALLESYEIRAPFDGILGFREVSVGTLVQPSDVITTINDLSRIKVDFDVPSVFLTALKPQLPITGYVEAFGDRAFNGKIETINTQVDPVTRTIKVRAILPNDDQLLKPGLLMSIKLSNNLRTALLIPEQTLIKQSDKNYVFKIVEEEGKIIAKKTQINIGSRQTGVVEVLSGLEKGDKIISHGLSKVRDGDAVNIQAEDDGETPLAELLKQRQNKEKGAK